MSVTWPTQLVFPPCTLGSSHTKLRGQPGNSDSTPQRPLHLEHPPPLSARETPAAAGPAQSWSSCGQALPSTLRGPIPVPPLDFHRPCRRFQRSPSILLVTPHVCFHTRVEALGHQE